MSNPPPPNASNLPPSDWIEFFNATPLERGRKLAVQGRVRNLVWHPTVFALTASVVSDRAEPAIVEIGLVRENDAWSVEDWDCSCASIRACPHVAAVLCSLYPSDRSSSPAPKPATLALPASLADWLQGAQSAATSTSSQTVTKPPPEHLVYVLLPDVESTRTCRHLSLATFRCRARKDGSPGKPTEFNLLNALRDSPARYVQTADVVVARRLHFAASQPASLYKRTIPLIGHDTDEILRLLLATGRCAWGQAMSAPLQLAAPRHSTPHWRRNSVGQLLPELEISPPASRVIACNPPWYVDEERRECGPLESPLASPLLKHWLEAPILDPIVAAEHAQPLGQGLQALGLPVPSAAPIQQVERVRPLPILHLGSAQVPWWEAPWRFRAGDGESKAVLAAQLLFAYGDQRVSPSDPASEVRSFNGSELTVMARDRASEDAAAGHLISLGLVRGSKAFNLSSNARLREGWTLEDRTDEALVRFLNEQVPSLRKEGWLIERDPDFALEVCQPTEWYFETLPDATEPQQDWFGVELGVRLGDEKINLLPVLLEGLRRNLDQFNPEKLKGRTATEPVLIQLPDGRRVPFPAGRLRDILATLLELHSPNSLAQDGRLRVHRLRAAQLGELAEAPRWVWSGADFLRDLSARLRKLEQLPQTQPPATLQTTLRPYQVEGLRWLQFLREFQLGGVLADDMGLGKTIQTLAHLLVEKDQGRLDRPVLVVSPTSVLTNWHEEIARFAPTLRVLPLHGSNRHTRFAEISNTDVVLTTYALLPRDAAELLKVDFHGVVLDEAQNIKNPKTQAAQVVCQLKARHRICLSGTPLENHLGELWSLFNFLIPGFLGDETRFRAVFRQPIERENNPERRRELARRVRPFLLRRKKDAVARELPERTEIVQKIELSDRQRDLYETIRLAMERRVREEVNKKGVSRSQIVILDALLKMRQVCCDPRLLPLESARNVTESAKLDHLMEWLPTLLEEGRRILLFSQFTSMLELLQQRLDAANIPWLLLTGETTDRATPVRRFQAGEVPLFLLSLKAGGSGLNLTAADTVILYDPWWNPAVEAQATDRAHRIGQTKPVFVYRLIASGTVEEKMAELQVRKRELVQSLLEDGTRGALQLQKEDLELLFAPIGQA